MFAFTDGCTPITSGILPTSATGATSLIGSNGMLERIAGEEACVLTMTPSV